MAPFRLSICIATYNRAAFIGQTLDSIIPQLTGDVELVIVDGASPDNTEQVVESRLAGRENVRYFRLSEKGGVDQDFCKSVELARGEYVWLFTDDDLFERDALARMLHELGEGYSLIVANARVLNNDLSETLAPKMLENSTDIVLEGQELDRLFDTIVPYVSFIGCVVMLRKTWLERDKGKYLGTEFVHVGVIFQSTFLGRIKVISDPLVAIRYGNAQWSTRASLIWLWKWPSILSSFGSVSNEIRRKKTSLASWGELKKMIVYRALRSYTLETYKKAMTLAPSPLWRKGCAFVVAVLPARILNILVSWYLRTFRWHTKEARMTLLDLSQVR